MSHTAHKNGHTRITTSDASVESKESSQSTNSHSKTNGHDAKTKDQKTKDQKAEDQTTPKNKDSALEKLFLDQLKDMYGAEQKITASLPKMQEAATTDELKDAFEDHLVQTRRHIKRLEKVFHILGKQPETKKCEAMEGLAKEVEEVIQATQEGTMTRDAALIIAAQKIEHHEIAAYGGLVQLAIAMRLNDAADLLDKTLVEEEDTDRLLTDIAEKDINLSAEHEANAYSWENQTRPLETHH